MRNKAEKEKEITFTDGSAVIVEVVRIDGAGRIVAAAAGSN